MKVVSSYTHALLDYPLGLILLLAPEIFGFTGLGGAAVWVPRVIGLVTLLQAIFTNYELGVFRMISMRTHLMGDYLMGALLIISPWLFGFSALTTATGATVVFGILTLLVAAVTEPEPRFRRVPAL